MIEPRWIAMCLVAAALYSAAKALTWSTRPATPASPWRHAAYLLAWPGMDSAAFLASMRSPVVCSRTGWLRAVGSLAVGALLLFAVARQIPTGDMYLVGWVGMIGFALILHFGVLQLVSCAWQAFDIDARPIMNQPLRSSSLGEFWGRRWNTAFRDLTYQFVFRPLRTRAGATISVLAGFLVSGVVHDLVISWPAGAGYGRPTLFFVIQGTAVLVERSRFGRRIGLARGALGRGFAIVILVAPLGLLFHRPFVIGIIVPLMHALGALS